MTQATHLVDFDDLEKYFEDRCRLTKQTMDLVADGSATATMATLNSTSRAISDSQKTFAETQDMLQEWKDCVSKAVELANRMKAASGTIAKATDEILEHPMISKKTASKENDQSRDSDTGQEGKRASKEGRGSSKPKLPEMAKIPYITLQDFKSVPKYMKGGRVTYDTVTTCIDEFNSALEKKYDFYLKGFQAMASIKDKNLYKQMKALETRETKGKYFVVAADLKQCTILNTESNRKTYFTILRHCHCLREIRGPGTTVRFTKY